DRFTRKDENIYLDALGLAERLFDDHMAANLIVLGAAYQVGAIPVAAEAIERAIALNGVSVEMNTQAFRAGRLAVADPAWAKTIKARRVGAVETTPALTAEARALVDLVGADGELRRLLEIRVPELIEYQDLAYARGFVGAFRALRAMRGLRGSALDPFGLPEVRRVERALSGEYRGLVEKALIGLDAASHARAVKLANLPDLIRGYEDIKLANVRRFHEEVRKL